jgi:hypothetical protein
MVDNQSRLSSAATAGRRDKGHEQSNHGLRQSMRDVATERHSSLNRDSVLDISHGVPEIRAEFGSNFSIIQLLFGYKCK